MKCLSIIVPCYNEEEALPIFHERMLAEMARLEAAGLRVEVLFVDDGSTDGSLALMKSLHEADARFGYLSFSRNFGKESAMYAGMENVHGDYVVIMDVDLQDPPELLTEMYRGITEEGYDCVGSRRVQRKGEPPIRSLFARMFYRSINRVSQVQIVDGARDFRMMTRQMVDALLSLKEKNRFSKGLFIWVGFRTKWLEYENIQRSAGETKWSFWKLAIYALDGFVSFSTAPLTLSVFAGGLFCLVSLVLLGLSLAGHGLWVPCLCFFLGGVQLLFLGVVGLYLSRMHVELKDRPIYILRERSGE